MGQTPQCRAYGCNWKKQIRDTMELPKDIVLEKCAWCDEERTVMERGY